MMKAISFLMVVLLLVSCNGNEDFVIDGFSEYEGALSLTFKSESNIRTVVLNPKRNYIKFKGTTYKDIKWTADFDEVECFSVDDNQILKVKFKNGEVFKFGKLNVESTPVVKESLGVFYRCASA